MVCRKFFLLLVAALFVADTLGSSAEINDESDLKLVHMVYRHGDRTPDNPTYPNDPYKTEKFYPYGYGQLTRPGYIREYENGKYFAKRYQKFLSPYYNQFEVYAQSTAYPRAIMSLQQFMNGMFNPKGTALEWDGGKNFQAFVFSNQPLTNDPLLFPLGMSCPRFGQELYAAYAPVVASKKALFNTITSLTGQNIVTPFDIIGIYYALKTEVEYGLPLPSWAVPYYPTILRDLSNEAWGKFVATDALKTILAGTFLQKLQSDWQAAIAGTSARKMFIYSAHDATVVSVLGACNVWNPLVAPDYGVTAIFELRQNKKSGEYGVQVYIRNQPKNEAELLVIPGCAAFCPIADFARLLANHLPTATSCNAV